jgi:hypothetical protein
MECKGLIIKAKGTVQGFGSMRYSNLIFQKVVNSKTGCHTS